METGVSINPVDLRPKRFGANEAGAKKKAEEKKRLEEQAKDLAMVYSDEAARFKELIMGRMEARIVKLIEADPQARAYCDLLRELGHKINIAKQATEKLYREQVRVDD